MKGMKRMRRKEHGTECHLYLFSFLSFGQGVRKKKEMYAQGIDPTTSASICNCRRRIPIVKRKHGVQIVVWGTGLSRGRMPV